MGTPVDDGEAPLPDVGAEGVRLVEGHGGGPPGPQERASGGEGGMGGRGGASPRRSGKQTPPPWNFLEHSRKTAFMVASPVW